MLQWHEFQNYSTVGADQGPIVCRVRGSSSGISLTGRSTCWDGICSATPSLPASVLSFATAAAGASIRCSAVLVLHADTFWLAPKAEASRLAASLAAFLRPAFRRFAALSCESMVLAFAFHRARARSLDRALPRLNRLPATPYVQKKTRGLENAGPMKLALRRYLRWLPVNGLAVWGVLLDLSSGGVFHVERPFRWWCPPADVFCLSIIRAAI